MVAPEFVPIVSAGIGAGAALAGVLLKMLYDGRAERRKQQKDDASLFLSERRDAYERFLELHRQQVDRNERLRKIGLTIRDGGTPPTDDEIAAFPSPVMADLAAALDVVRRLARSYEVVRAGEQMVRLHGDMAVAQRKMLDAVTARGGNRELSFHEKETDDILWFLLTNILRDRTLEFSYAYRVDLGIGDPRGGPKKYPTEPRPWPLEDSEHVLRAHILPSHLKARGEVAEGKSQPPTKEHSTHAP
ncbi:hypothetical protein [Micromonospora sp. HUAS LYJ1]|uniref:hypothetical protein n=1 Tax=Micromonospora sp. HUAS LYJ1 TaxID=3061626 RepID=UPI0026731EB5|nr:hypothetical protein [Micromonospora sp. HUAS LYJ1]WKU04954.1 hypothetical protein Q2K16_30035 [Micromonospora sp. HUAS LYJ1]